MQKTLTVCIMGVVRFLVCMQSLLALNPLTSSLSFLPSYWTYVLWWERAKLYDMMMVFEIALKSDWKRLNVCLGNVWTCTSFALEFRSNHKGLVRKGLWHGMWSSSYEDLVSGRMIWNIVINHTLRANINIKFARYHTVLYTNITFSSRYSSFRNHHPRHHS